MRKHEESAIEKMFAFTGLMILIAMIGIFSYVTYQYVHLTEKIEVKTHECDSLMNQLHEFDSTFESNKKLPIDEDQYIVTVTGTKYQPCVEQCDSTPFNTADGSFIEVDKLMKGEIRWVALSRDLLWYKGGMFHYGDSIYVHSEQDNIRGWWEVHDCMNERYTNRIDFLQWHDDKIKGLNHNLLISNKIIGNDR